MQLSRETMTVIDERKQRGAYGLKRTMKAAWLMAEVGDKQIVASLSCSHHKDSKTFLATLTRQTESDERGFHVTTFTMFQDNLTITREQVARYSDKALAEFFERSVDKLIDLQDIEAVQALLQIEGATT